MTLPAGMVRLYACVTVPTVSPTARIAACASAWPSPTTNGTGPAPLDTTRFTAAPGNALAPAAGVWLITSPTGTVALYCCVTVTDSPALMIAAWAAAWAIPTTAGTITGCGPLDTIKLTGVPGATIVPAAGTWLITLPNGTLELYARVTVPTVSPMARIAACASPRLWPTTLGTGPAPLDTTRFTAAPGNASEPAPGV
jgi:hypothetical protein